MGIPVRHGFLLAVPVEEAWRILRDLPRITPHMPGATLDSVTGDYADGRLRVRLRRLTVTYRGRLLLLSADPAEGEFVVEAEAREARGEGRASATIAGRLTDEGGSTRVAIDADVTVTGRGALVEPAVLAAAGERLLTRFGASLAAQAARPAGEGAADAPPPAEGPPVVVPRPAAEADPLVAAQGGKPPVMVAGEESPVTVAAPESAARPGAVAVARRVGAPPGGRAAPRPRTASTEPARPPRTIRLPSLLPLLPAACAAAAVLIAVRRLLRSRRRAPGRAARPGRR
ncbi:hypothetical protein ACFO4E_14585 [Nocardiopsis mangrovi]|uniref:Carbon monoxide dehydrogenase subunit G n=1 Tax=Nocardiopsis mangrovi TaxID=1179818 RepID=A0ABV9DYT4_9ACTN